MNHRSPGLVKAAAKPRGSDHSSVRKGTPPGKPAGRLNAQQARFIELLVVEGMTGADAARGAGYSQESAKVHACRLRALPHVKIAIEKMRETLGEESLDRRERYLEELRRVAYADMGDLLEADGTLKRIQDMPEHARRALASVDVREVFDNAKGDQRSIVGLAKRFKLSDKLRALEILGKAEGWLKEEVAIRGHVTLEQLLAGKGGDDGEA